MADNVFNADLFSNIKRIIVTGVIHQHYIIHYVKRDLFIRFAQSKRSIVCRENNYYFLSFDH